MQRVLVGRGPALRAPFIISAKQFKTNSTPAPAKDAGDYTSYLPMNTNTIGKVIKAVSEFTPHKDVLVVPFQGTRHTYTEVEENINAIARGFYQSGLAGGNVVSFFVENNVENIVCRLGAGRVGTVLAHHDVADHDGFVLRLKQVNPSGFIVSPTCDTFNNIKYLKQVIPGLSEDHIVYRSGEKLKLKEYPNLKIAIHTHLSDCFHNFYGLTDLLSHQTIQDPLPKYEKKVNASDIAEIYYTRFRPDSAPNQSQQAFQFGATPLTFTQEAVVKSALSFGKSANLTNLRVCFAGSLSTPEVQTLMLACYAYNSVIIIPTPFFEPFTIVKRLIEEYTDTLVATPSELAKLLEMPEISGAKDLKRVIVISNPHDGTPASLFDSIRQKIKSVTQIDDYFIADGFLAPFELTPSISRIADGKLWVQSSNADTSGVYNDKAGIKLSEDGWINTHANASMSNNQVVVTPRTIQHKEKDLIDECFNAIIEGIKQNRDPDEVLQEKGLDINAISADYEKASKEFEDTVKSASSDPKQAAIFKQLKEERDQINAEAKQELQELREKIKKITFNANITVGDIKRAEKRHAERKQQQQQQQQQQNEIYMPEIVIEEQEIPLQN